MPPVLRVETALLLEKRRCRPGKRGPRAQLWSVTRTRHGAGLGPTIARRSVRLQQSCLAVVPLMEVCECCGFLGLAPRVQIMVVQAPNSLAMRASFGVSGNAATYAEKSFVVCQARVKEMSRRLVPRATIWMKALMEGETGLAAEMCNFALMYDAVGWWR